MKIAIWNIAKVKPYPNNPRNNDAAVDAVAASIAEYGWQQPIVVDTEGVIICGHTRYRAALKLGLEKVPVHVAANLSPEQAKAYRIADNKTAELAEWDKDLLRSEIESLQGVNLATLAFDPDELRLLLGETVQCGAIDPDSIPAPPDEAITKPGDIWVLGAHRLMCGDSSSEADLDKLLAGAVVHLVHCDPPYNVVIQSRSTESLIMIV